MTDQKTVSALIVKAVIEVLIELNLPANEFCQKLNLNMDTLTSPHDRVPEAAFGGLMHMARLHSNIPSLGLLIGERLLPSALGQFGFNLMTADNVQEVISRAMKYQQHLGNSMSLDIEHDTDYYTVSINIDMPHSETSDLIMDLAMANVFHSTCWIFGNNELHPKSCHFTRTMPDNINDYKKYFKCPVYFGQESNTFVAPIQLLERKSPSRNKQLDEVNEYELQRIVACSGEQSLTQLVEKQILELLPSGDISMATIASNFNISERTLLRRLKEEDCTFLELVDQTRKILSKHYIEKTESSFQEITFALGFKDSSTFYRAFKRWYGQTPSQFKRLCPAPNISSTSHTNGPSHMSNSSL